MLAIVRIVGLNPLPLQFDYFLRTTGEASYFSPILSARALWSVAVAFLAKISSPTKIAVTGASKILIGLSIILVAFFRTKSVLVLYLAFEASLVPILLLVLGWGYQPERVFAGLRILFYTIVASLPLLIVIASHYRSRLSTTSTLTPVIFSPLNNLPPRFLILSLSLGFLVKLPIFLGHL